MDELSVDHFRRPRVHDPEIGSPDIQPLGPSTVLTPMGQPIEGEILSTEPAEPFKHLQPYQRIDFQKIESRQQLMTELNTILPLNEFNLPRYFYRADLLDFRHLAQLADGIQEYLEAATEHLDFHHGYPTLRTGMPWWSQLSYESAEAYGAFVDYLEVPGVRTFATLKAYTPSILTEWFHTYNWSSRARSYDMYRMSHHTRMRMRRIMDTEDDHYLESQRMFKSVAKAFNNKTAEELLAQEPKALVDMLEKLAKLQRVSAGLPANGAPEPQKVQQPLSLEVQMRQIAETDGPNSTQNEQFDTLELLQNPDALRTAQELIVKVSQK